MGRAWGTLCRSDPAIIAEKEKRRGRRRTTEERERERVKDIERSLEGIDVLEGGPRERRGGRREV